ncbi:MAG TPA: response regulator [Tepidisphaeraceae bacterium]|jgi:CheY-like chemotaxis protein|nr:response regulator [Tepidisphaeraceae bacterium]
MSATATIPAPNAPATATKTTVMIVEDTPFWQKQIEQALQAAGFATVLANNGKEALVLLEKHKPRVVVSDIEMPEMTGLEFLNAVRAKPEYLKLPIIMLTTSAAKERILEATRLKAGEYMLKGSFNGDQLADRVKKWLTPPTKAAATANPAAPKAVASAFPRLLQRNEVVAAVTKLAATGKTLANVVASATELCKTSKNNPAALLDIVKHDPIFAMRVMQQANASKRVGTLDEAVKVLGADAISVIAQSLTPQPATSRGALAACQHSIAVASVMHKIVPRSFEMSLGVTYLIGLLHDLPEILLRQAFPAQYEAATDFADQANRSLRQIMPDVFSVSMAEIAGELATLLKLPPLIATPLREYAAATGAIGSEAGRPGPMVDRLALALRYAEYYANALQLPLTPYSASIAPLTLTDCRTAYIATDAINGSEIRSHTLEITKQLHGDAANQPATSEAKPKIWYARHNSFAPLDPVEEALKLLADVVVYSEPPSKREHFDNLNGVIVCAPSIDTFGLLWCLPDRMPQASATNRLNVLHVLPSSNADSKRAAAENINTLCYPFSQATLEATFKLFR